MSERYTRLFALPENLYASGAPVLIAARALQKDNQTGRVLAQLKLRNISANRIKAAKVALSPLDVGGKSLGSDVTYQYLDITVERDAEFGQKVPIPLPDNTTRSFGVSVTEVIFNDNSVWTASDAPWETLAKPVPLNTQYDLELLQQFRLKFGERSQYVAAEQKDLWYCTCGALNRAGEPACHRCKNGLHTLQSVDLDELKAERDARLAEERRKAEEARAAAEEKAAKTRKIGLIAAAITAVVIVAVILVTKVIVPAQKYNVAVALMESGEYEQAIAAFEEMGEYKDASAKIDACSEKIQELEEQKRQEAAYQEAAALADRGEFGKAALAFDEIGDYRDAVEQSKMLWKEFRKADSRLGNTLSAGAEHTIGLKNDGTVVAKGFNKEGQCDVSGWTDIVAIFAGDYHTVGLKSDGTVTAVGDNKFGQCDVSGWTDIVAVSAGYIHTVGLKSDGTVTVVGDDFDGECDVSGWKDIIAVSAGPLHTVGLKSDGTVVASGYNENGECNVSDWTDIIAISAGNCYTAGLKSDGTVTAVGNIFKGEFDVSEWTDIVAISAKWDHIVGLKSDGTVVASAIYRDYFYGQYDVSEWKDIIAISAGVDHTVGLKKDGTIIAAGRIDDITDGTYTRKRGDEIDWENDWTDIRLPG